MSLCGFLLAFLFIGMTYKVMNDDRKRMTREFQVVVDQMNYELRLLDTKIDFLEKNEEKTANVIDAINSVIRELVKYEDATIASFIDVHKEIILLKQEDTNIVPQDRSYWTGEDQNGFKFENWDMRRKKICIQDGCIEFSEKNGDCIKDGCTKWSWA